MTTKRLLAGIATLTASLSAVSKEVASDRPNILLIMADDMGFSDLGCYGSEISTPNLDQLAFEGVRFTQFYNCAICWPTRTAIMTGYYGAQTGSEPYRGGPKYVKWTKPLPQLMNDVGYRTYQSGKWHVLATGCNSAHAAGFNHAYDYAQGYLDYTPMYHAVDGVLCPRPKIEDNFFMDQATGTRMSEFLTEHYKEHADQPFFAYMAFNGPHYPLKAPKEYVDKYDGKYDEGWDVIRQRRFEKQQKLGFPSSWKLSEQEPQAIPTHAPHADAERKAMDEKQGFKDVYQYVTWDTLSAEQKKQQADKMEIHAAMVNVIDDQVGRIITLLKEKGTLDNTVVLFLSDNGASAQQMLEDPLPDNLRYEIDKTARWGSEYTCLCLGPAWANVCNTPMRRYKLWAHEGGISTPLIVHWPKGIKKNLGGFVATRGHVIDFVPTFLDLAGSDLTKASPEAPTFPGKSLLPALSGKEVPRDYLYFNNWNNHALIKGKWKLVSSPTDGNKWELYDIESDRTEMNNLRDKYPEALQEMIKAWVKLDGEFTQQWRQGCE